MKINQLLHSIEKLSPEEKQKLLRSLSSSDVPNNGDGTNDFAARIKREVPSWDADSYRNYLQSQAG
ncbi:hypothetical protein CEQ90_12615 [Lewinellaceae bacterium SD302]|nr:hypothetical protein CEQ90_12615 [Lewinellaceae bacterium SD302]